MCVFSTHGRRAVERIIHHEVNYGLDEEDERKLIRDYQSQGYGYADYPGQPGYGISAVSRDKMEKLAATAGNWEPVMFLDHGWDQCQDVFAFAKH